MNNASEFKFPVADTVLTAVVTGGLGLMFAAIGISQGVQAVFA